MITTGAIVYDKKNKRMDVRFNLERYYGGLHYGKTMEVLLDNAWHQTRIEKSWLSKAGYKNGGWYLVGIETKDITGLIVRV